MNLTAWLAATGFPPSGPAVVLKLPNPKFSGVFIAGTVTKLNPPDCFELANVTISPHAGVGARVALSGFSLVVQYDPAGLKLKGLKPGIGVSLAVDISWRDARTIHTVARRVF
jgi:hypothetical protein